MKAHCWDKMILERIKPILLGRILEKIFKKKVTRLGGLKSEKQIGLSSLEIREIILELTEGGTQLVLKK